MNEEQIKNLSDDLNTANINNLLQYRQSDVISKVEILAAPDSC